MGTSWLWIMGGLLLLTLGADGLVRGASSFARWAGLSPLIIGLTVVAYGTSAPELVVSLQAAVGGNPDISLGNVVGSNIGNIGLILGGAALLSPLRAQAQFLRFDVPIMVGGSVLLVGLLVDEVIGRMNGIVLVGGAVAYTLMCIWGATDESKGSVDEEFDEGVPETMSWSWTLVSIGGGLVLLVLGAQMLVSGAVTIAEGLGVPAIVIGLTVVAVGTSLPELATSLAAARRGQSDLVLGNVVGSNIFNILGILGLSACIHPLDASGVSWLDAGVLVGFSVLTLPLLWTGYSFSRWEGGVLLSAYVGYVVLLVILAV